MRLLIILTFLAICYGFEEPKIKQKRGIFGEGLFLGGLQYFGGLFYINHGISSPNNDLGSITHKHLTVTNNIAVPVPQPYPVQIERNIAVPVPHPVALPIDKPYTVQIPKPYAVPVDKPYPVTVEKSVPYPVNVPVKVPVSVPVAVPIPKPIPVVVRKVPYAVSEPVEIYKTVPYVKAPIVSIGSGSLGYTHLGNGAYALGSGSLGISGLAINRAINNVPNLW